jgi:hypothetical protein
LTRGYRCRQPAHFVGAHSFRIVGDSKGSPLATITGAALARMEAAKRVSLLEAALPEEPGWYTLELAGNAGGTGQWEEQEVVVLFVGETEDLRARLMWHHDRLQASRQVALEHVYVRWVAARPIMGSQAWERRARRAVEIVLVATLCPIWDTDMVEAVLPLGP